MVISNYKTLWEFQMKFKSLAVAALSVSVLSAFYIPGANAAGFYIQEQSVKGLGSAFSGSTTSIDDASTVYFNPAGMTKLSGPQMNAGVHLLIPSADLTNTGSTFDFNGPAPGGIGPIVGNDGGNPYSPTPVPNLFVAYPIVQDQVWAGLAINVPFGLANEYDTGWFGRYDSTETELTTINIQPSIAVKATNWLSIGAGVDIQRADATLKSAISNVVSEGESKLTGDDWSYGYNIGLQIKPVESTEIGLHYRSAIKHTLEGRISVQGLSASNFDIPGTADLNLPDIASFGIAHQATDKLRLMAEANWFGWNNFQEIHAKNTAGGTVSNVVQNYQTTWAFSVGGEYDVNDKWTVRAGYQHDATPTTDLYRTSRTPDGDRNWFSGGATYKINPKLDLDLAATYIDISKEKINLSRNSGLANISANTEGSVGIVAVGLTYKF